MPPALPFVLLIAVLAPSSSAAQGYDERRALDVKRCEGIDPSAYQTGLGMNPDGYRSFYLRSQCFQETAVRYRDGRLCANVRRRYALTSSSWGYSASRCRALVEDGRAADRKVVDDLKARYARGHLVLRDFELKLNGNGRDFDVLPTLSGGPGAGYALTVEALRSGGAPVVIFRNGYFLDSTSMMRLYVRREDVLQKFPALAADRPQRLRMTITLSMPLGNNDAVWSDAFVEGAFPARERSQAITKDVAIPPILPPRRLR